MEGLLFICRVSHFLPLISVPQRMLLIPVVMALVTLVSKCYTVHCLAPGFTCQINFIQLLASHNISIYYLLKQI